jgi:hypothetical protein
LSSLRVIASRITTKKVPALALVVVGIIGMVAGVLAATITVTTNPYTGESGTYHNNTGAISVNDKGLSIVSNVTGISANGTATFGVNLSNSNLFNGSTFTLGHWMETLVFSITTTGGSHTVTIKIQSGSTPPNGGTNLAGGTVTLTLTGPGSTSTGTITAYLDLGVAAITGPMTVYVNAT